MLSTILGGLALLIPWLSGAFDAPSTNDVSIRPLVGLCIFCPTTCTVVIFCTVALPSSVMATFVAQPAHADTGWAAARTPADCVRSDVMHAHLT